MTNKKEGNGVETSPPILYVIILLPGLYNTKTYND
jgi:hypothetical protein